MAEKNNNNGVENKNKNNDGGEKKKADGSHGNFVKLVKSFQGAESVKSEGQANKLTVVGIVDPTKLRDEPATKTKTKTWAPKPKCALVPNVPSLLLNPPYLESYYNSTKSKGEVINSTNRYGSEAGSGAEPRSPAAGFYISNDVWDGPDDGSDSDDNNNGNNGNHGNDGKHGNNRKDRNDGNGGGGGVEKKKKEDEGNGGGKMKYPAGQSQFGQFSYGKGCRHSYGYQNGALKTGEIRHGTSRCVKRDRPIQHDTSRVEVSLSECT